jgi:hypothetical protein
MKVFCNYLGCRTPCHIQVFHFLRDFVKVFHFLTRAQIQVIHK